MPRGKYVNHKGRSRHFTNPEELEQERLKEQKKKSKKLQKTEEEESDSESPEEEEEEEAAAASDQEEEEEDSDEEDEKPKGVSGLIEINNPNRVKKTTQKLGRLNIDEGASAKPELSRREQEQIEKEKARRQYMKLHAEGKTKQAREDLARLAIIKQHRAEAAARREQEKKEKEEARKKSGNA